MVNIPSSLNTVWQQVANDGDVTGNDYGQIIKEAYKSVLSEEDLGNLSVLLNKTLSSESISQDEVNNLVKLLSAKQNLDPDIIAFIDSIDQKAVQFGGDYSFKDPTFKLLVKEGSAEGTFDFINDENNSLPKKENSENLTEVKKTASLPKFKSQIYWSGSYNNQVVGEFSSAYNGLSVVGGKVPYISKEETKPIVSALNGYNSQVNSVESLQALVGAEPDSAFGPETFQKLKEYIVSEINNTDDLSKLSSLSDAIGDKGLLGNPSSSEAGNILQYINQKISSIKKEQDVILPFANKIKERINQAKSEGTLEGLENAIKDFDSLKEEVLKNNPELVNDISVYHQTAVDWANTQIIDNILPKEITSIASEAILKSQQTGSNSSINSAIDKLDSLSKKYPIINETKDMKSSLDSSKKLLEIQRSSINEINEILGKPEKTSEDIAKLESFISTDTFPDGEFKTKVSIVLSEYKDKKEYISQHLDKDIKDGLEDVIGRGFFNAQNSDGTKAIFQQLAKSGTLDSALTTLSYDDQVRAIKILTKGLKHKNKDEFSSEQNFNLSIARNIYANLEKSNISGIDKEFNKRVDKLIENTDPKDNFNGFKVSKESFQEGLEYSMYSEKSAARTMIRGVLTGDVPADYLKDFSGSEVKKIVSLISDDSDKEKLLKIMSGTEDVNTKRLKRDDKATVLKNQIKSDSPDVSGSFIQKAPKKVVFELIKDYGDDLTSKELSLIAKNTNGDKMADEPKVAAKLLFSMFEVLHSEKDSDEKTISKSDVLNFINEVDKDWWEDDDTMKNLLEMFGDISDDESLGSKINKDFPSLFDLVKDISN